LLHHRSQISEKLLASLTDVIIVTPMKYIGDSMLNGLEKFMTKAGIDFVTATYALRNDRDSSVRIPDGRIFRFVLEKKYGLVPRAGAEDYTRITSDKELQKYCEAFDIRCIYVEKPATRKEFDEMATKLVERLKSSQ
jgi:hypothetical protein